MALAFSLPLIMAPVYKTLYLVVPLLPCVSFVRFFPVLLILRIRRECDARRGGVEWSVGAPRAATFAEEILQQCNQRIFVRA
jgi:hypothetical protein